MITMRKVGLRVRKSEYSPHTRKNDLTPNGPRNQCCYMGTAAGQVERNLWDRRLARISARAEFGLSVASWEPSQRETIMADVIVANFAIREADLDLFLEFMPPGPVLGMIDGRNTGVTERLADARVEGLCDINEPDDSIADAIKLVAAGCYYLSPTVATLWHRRTILNDQRTHRA